MCWLSSKKCNSSYYKPYKQSCMLERIKKVIAAVLENPGLETSLSDDADLITDVGLDSLQMIEFMLQIEQEFDTEIDLETLNFDHMRSIHQFGSFLAIQLGKGQEAK